MGVSNWLTMDLAQAGLLKKKFKSAKPYPHLVLPNFFTNKIDTVAHALKNEKFHRQNSDLFQFDQTNDCKNAKTKAVKEFYKMFTSKEFLKLISEITGKKFKSADMSGFIYHDTDYLLPHDDRLEGRKVAYVVNLSRHFTKQNGGALRLFKGKRIVKVIPPTYNTLTIFEVSKKSLHDVQEVMHNKRISFAGWFHG